LRIWRNVVYEDRLLEFLRRSNYMPSRSYANPTKV
jgi:hypothetical protein